MKVVQKFSSEKVILCFEFSTAESKELIAQDMALLKRLHLAKMLFNSADWLQQYTSNGRN